MFLGKELERIFMIKKLKIMELTLENLLIFFENKNYVEGKVFPESKIRNDFNIELDGDDVLYLLQELEEEFQVTFEKFNFRDYFLQEAELCTLISFDTFFKKKRVRKIEKELTIQELFNFMIMNRK